MSSQRGFSPARIAPEAGVLLLTAGLLVAGCSSVAAPDLQADAALTGGTGDTEEFGSTSGGPDDPLTSSGGGMVTGASSDGSSAGGTTGAESGGGTVPPEELPEPHDALVEADPLLDGCSAASLQWMVAVREQGAMTSPAHAREAMLADWPSLDEVSIRPWEFLNYYSFPYALAPAGQLLPGAELRQGVDDLGDMFELQVAVAGPELLADDRPPVHLTLALDNSGAMEGKAVGLLKSAGAALASQLRAGDTVALTSWNEADAVLLPVTPVKGPNDAALLSAFASFTPGGATDLHTAVTSSYQLAKQAYVPTDINRVVVITGGGATATAADLQEIASWAVDAPGKPGIHLVGVGVGDAANYRRGLVDAVALAGGGTSLYIGSEAEATRQLGERFVSALAIAALDVEVRLTLPPGLQIEDLAADAGVAAMDRVLVAPNDRAIVQRVLRPCAKVDPTAKVRVEVKWVDAASGAAKNAMKEWTVGDLLAGDGLALKKGAAVLAYAAALSGWKLGDLGPLKAAQARLDEATAALPGDPELAELAEVLAALQGV